MSKKVRPDPPKSYCNHEGPRGLTCCLRPHDEGDHGCWSPEGSKNAAWVPWPRTYSRPKSDVEPPKRQNQETHTPYDITVQARAQGYTGDICTHCSSTKMRRNGSCLVCEVCGETTGCS